MEDIKILEIQHKIAHLKKEYEDNIFKLKVEIISLYTLEDLKWDKSLIRFCPLNKIV